MRFIIFFLVLYSFLEAKNSSIIYEKKGAKVSKIFCDASKFPKNTKTIKETFDKLKSTNACSDIDDKKLKWVAYYILNNKKIDINKEIKVPKEAKCPVCGMFVAKYPKWAALMVINSKNYYFDGIKDMMKYYFFDGDFSYDRTKIDKILVTNYYTLKEINAKDAFYVYDSKIFGPMGRELIAFKTKKEAQNFINDHGGKLMRFSDITPKNVMALDGVELDGN